MEIQELDIIDLIGAHEEYIVHMDDLRRIRFPILCPYCLKPGNIQKQFPFQVQNGRYTMSGSIPFSTHRECSEGWRKKDISGSVKIYSSTRGLGLKFSNSTFSLIFSRVNFEILRNVRGFKLANVLRDKIKNNRRTFHAIESCPRCQASFDKKLEECPSCEFDLSKDYHSIESIALQEAKLDYSFVITCPSCGIKMFNDEKISNCGICGSKIELDIESS